MSRYIVRSRLRFPYDVDMYEVYDTWYSDDEPLASFRRCGDARWFRHSMETMTTLAFGVAWRSLGLKTLDAYRDRYWGSDPV